LKVNKSKHFKIKLWADKRLEDTYPLNIYTGCNNFGYPQTICSKVM